MAVVEVEIYTVGSTSVGLFALYILNHKLNLCI